MKIVVALLACLFMVGQVVADDYNNVREAAISSRKPLIVGVGISEVPEGNWLTWETQGPWYDWKEPCIIVSVPITNDLRWVIDLPVNATADDIRRAISQPQTRPQARIAVQSVSSC